MVSAWQFFASPSVHMCTTAPAREPAESYSDVIVRLVETTAFDDERVV